MEKFTVFFLLDGESSFSLIDRSCCCSEESTNLSSILLASLLKEHVNLVFIQVTIFIV